MSGVEQEGRLSAAMIVDLPADDPYRQKQGHTSRRSIPLGEWTCTETEGIAMAKAIRAKNPSIAEGVQIVWNGPRTL